MLFRRGWDKLIRVTDGRGRTLFYADITPSIIVVKWSFPSSRVKSSNELFRADYYKCISCVYTVEASRVMIVVSFMAVGDIALYGYWIQASYFPICT